jgi:hypothetical protein
MYLLSQSIELKLAVAPTLKTAFLNVKAKNLTCARIDILAIILWNRYRQAPQRYLASDFPLV